MRVLARDVDFYMWILWRNVAMIRSGTRRLYEARITDDEAFMDSDDFNLHFVTSS
jgi:hypothetical protein